MDSEIKGEFDKINQKMDKRFKSVDLRFDRLMGFLYENMVTKSEMEERFSQLPTKEDYNVLQSSVDNLARITNSYYQETQILAEKVNKL